MQNTTQQTKKMSNTVRRKHRGNIHGMLMKTPGEHTWYVNESIVSMSTSYSIIHIKISVCQIYGL